MIQKLDYINDGNAQSKRDLGAGCIWLMPIMESPSYHGYDVSNYYEVKREYGTNDDFKRLVSAAHKRGIRVLIDMVINHTSSEYPPFKTALADTTSPHRSLFRWSPVRGPNNKWGGNNWHKSPRFNEFYYGFFYRGMPDLNYEHPAALAEMKKVATFWLSQMGVDGFRLDAVKYLVESGSQADDTPATHEVLRQYAAHVRTIEPTAFTIGEVFDSTGALFPYYPDQLDGYFAFEIADSIVAGVRAGRATGMLAPVLRLQSRIKPNRWSPFLRNHDQPRTRTELGGSIAKARVAATLLLTMPGFPFVYYGEELGMSATKPDEQLRTPLAWTTAGPHAGFTTAKPWEALLPDSLSANIAMQNADSSSLLDLYRTLIHYRSANSALATAPLVPVATGNPAVVAYLRSMGPRVVLVVANLGDSAVGGIALSSDAGTLATGSYTARRVVGGVKPARVVSGVQGKLAQYVPFATLAPTTAYVIELSRIRVR